MTAPEPVQTKRQIEAALAAAGLRPRKNFGQHFLIDGNLMRRLVDAADIQPADLVIEVGPGTGGLTDLLVSRGGRVIIVEIDRGLCVLLAERFGQTPSLQLIEGDALEQKHRLHPALADVLATAVKENVVAKLVANLPYQVATPLVMNLLIDYPAVRRLVFTVQAEVGERMMAAPGGRDYGPLSILCRTLCRIETLARIPPEAFWPQPAVDSVMLRLDVLSPSKLSRPQVARFAGLVRKTFEHRRKALRGALRYVVDPPVLVRLGEGMDLTRRPETLDHAEWLALFEWLESAAAPPADG